MIPYQAKLAKSFERLHYINVKYNIIRNHMSYGTTSIVILPAVPTPLILPVLSYLTHIAHSVTKASQIS